MDSNRILCVAACRLMLLACGAFANGVVAEQAVPPPEQAQETKAMRQHARGTFDVKMTPDGNVDEADGVSLGHMRLEKRFHGDLEAEGKGRMLTTMTPVKGSAVYVAIERVAGTLHGRSGSFVLSHRGIMNQGAQELSVRIVSDSGTGELAGIAGELVITIVDGEHRYELTYTLPDPG